MAVEERRARRRRRLRRVAVWTLTRPLKAAWWLTRKAFVAGWRTARFVARRKQDEPEQGEPRR